VLKPTPFRPRIRIPHWRPGFFFQPDAKGLVILFHGFTATKSFLRAEAKGFLDQQMNVLLVDFRASGGSEGTTTTIGYTESYDVLRVLEFVGRRKLAGNLPVWLFGQSMGAAAILRAFAVVPKINSYRNLRGLILECPFNRMSATVKNRFKIYNVPATGLSELLMLWGSAQLGFWAFNHNPEDYAREVKIPTLIMAGGADKMARPEEVKAIFLKLSTPESWKKYYEFAGIGHLSYARTMYNSWNRQICDFLMVSARFQGI
jgi:hypothetical protein